MFDSKIKQLELLTAQYEKLLALSAAHGAAESVNQEKFLLKRVLDELTWDSLEDTVKQEKRKAAVVLLDKWSYEEGSAGNIAYEKSVVELYERIEALLSELTEDTTFSIRLKALLLIEKSFINEQKEFSKMRHMDYYIWSELFADNQAKIYYPLELAELNATFREMYRNWPKRPYKDIA
ncbi:hypothetical protein J0X19_03625 [Hymenobacter sp. BT186]|uniref:Uncharacterized protein n=1 Tax=Hymenobacter telluris TaxID=2816474 RepID=A0A939J7S3_9BACT|nr:hypothetical protein [Hymenobacter telluris]MBO0357024.1 hypothetical protein [Hymenobacter telluris]MBW3373051.1 hypothetical protein [Hymenobacter norwichensis]